jgi:uncharacterized delta-60 repeat protein
MKLPLYLKLTLALCFFSARQFASAAPGDLDPAFGSNGRLLTRFPIVSTTFRPRSNSNALAIQPDGRIISAGQAVVQHSLGGERNAFAVIRYLQNGNLDESFGTGGKLTTEVAQNDTALAVALQADGKIIVGGFATVGPDNFAFALVRYETDGDLDLTFDGDGKVITDLTPFLDEVTGVAVQPDGKIIAAGFANAGSGTDFAVVRYHENGSLDSSFGVGGIVRTDFSGGVDGASEMALLADGKIVVAGTTYDNTGQGDFALIRYNTNGSLDESFGTGGKVRADFGSDDNVADLAVAHDGKLVVAGATRLSGTFDMAVARYNADGSADATFNGNGRFVEDFSPGTTDRASSVAVQQNGKIIVGGDAHGDGGFDFALLRLNANGSIDSSFGNNGKVRTDFGGLAAPGFTNDSLGDIVIQADGKIVASGDAEVEPNRLHDTALARYIGDPAALRAVSRKTHGAAGTFDLDLPFTGSRGIEPRSGGATGEHQVIVSFSGAVTMTQAAVTSGTVTNYSVNGSEVTLNLSGIPNAQPFSITLEGVNNGTSIGAVEVRMATLVGDVNRNGVVNASDVAATKAQSNQVLDAQNATADVTANGTINASDVGLVKATAGTSLP